MFQSPPSSTGAVYWSQVTWKKHWVSYCYEQPLDVFDGVFKVTTRPLKAEDVYSDSDNKWRKKGGNKSMAISGS